MTSVASLMPMIAISGRWRFGGFKAASVASASSFAIGGAAVISRRRRQRKNPCPADRHEKRDGAQTAPQYEPPIHRTRLRSAGSWPHSQSSADAFYLE